MGEPGVTTDTDAVAVEDVVCAIGVAEVAEEWGEGTVTLKRFAYAARDESRLRRTVPKTMVAAGGATCVVVLERAGTGKKRRLRLSAGNQCRMVVALGSC